MMEIDGLSKQGAPLLPSVAAFIDPEANDGTHRSSLNAVLLHMHRAKKNPSLTGFEALIKDHMSEYLTSDDIKVRERGTLLLAEVLQRLPELPITHKSSLTLVTFFTSRLEDYPSVLPSLQALRALVKHHTAEVGSASTLIAEGLLDGLHLPALNQLVRQETMLLMRELLLAPQTRRGLLEMGEGSHCLSSFIESMRGEKDPRCLLVALEVLKLLQEHCPAETVSSLAEQLFDATACYFPVTFTPPPNDKHGITRDDLANALLEVQLGHSAMMPFLMPMLVDKIASSAVQAQLAAMKTAGVALERFGVAAAASQLSGLSGELFRAAVEGAEELVSEMALKCFTQVGALLAAQGGAREWKDFAGAAIGSAMSELEITPDSMLARSGVKVMFAIAVSSAHGLREVLAAAVAPLICLQAEAHTAGARSAALGALALLIGAVNDTVDFWPSPVAPYMDVLYSQLVGVLQSSDASQEDICVAIAGLSALVIRPPSALVETEKVKHLVESFTSMIIEEGASPAVGEARITEASSARVALNSLLAIGGRRDEYQQLMLVTSLEPLLEGIRALGKYKSAQVLPGLGRLLQAVCELCLLERVFCLAVPTLLDLSLEGWGPASAAILATLATALRDRKHNKGGVLEFTQGGALMRLVGAAEEGLLPDSEGCLVSAASICSTCTQSLPLEAQDELAAAMLQRRWQEVQGKGTRPLLALATAVLASLSQESVVLRSEELLGGVMQSLVNVASEGAEAQATDVVAAAKCVAAILNKVPEGPLLDRAVATVMAAAAGSSSTAPPVDLIAWSLKGALLRGMAHKELLESLCALLAGSAGDEIAMRAAGGVTTIMAEARDVLSLDCNALVSPFWRQRLFGEMFPRLSAAHGMLHLAKSVPKAVLEPVLDDALDAAVEGLRTKDVAPLVCAALDTLQVLCKDWPSALAACLAELIPLLLELAQSHAKARARLLALRGLMEVTKLPQGQLYPFKARVIKELVPPLDDGKQAVRQAAVRVRNKWMVIL